LTKKAHLGQTRFVANGESAEPREPGTVHWLAVSLVLSIVLTIVLNVVLRAFPDLGDRIGRKFEELEARTHRADPADGRRVRVVVPWKAMIIASVALTILVNLVLWIR